MIFTSDCMECLIARQYKDIKHYSGAQKKKEFFKEILHCVNSAPTGVNAPVVFAELCRIQEKYFGPIYDYAAEKEKYNTLMMNIEDSLRAKIEQSADPLLYALKLSRAGNYIDFGALKEVDDNALLSLLENCADTDISKGEYENFKNDLKTAKRLTLLCDNCGEIVCDKLLLQIIKKLYPQVEVIAAVRNIPALNDVTEDDALLVKLNETAQIVKNGTDVAGTPLDLISKELKDILETSDVIISKGQANFETLFGCGLNIYYIFLLKCDLFSEIFGLEKFTGMFINDKNVHIPEEYIK